MKASMQRALIILALGLTLGLPFYLRPRHVSVPRVAETLVVITPHNEALRSEYSRGFHDWYFARTGQSIAIDWRVIGGTTEITRFIESEYLASFQRYWTAQLGRPWSMTVQGAFANPVWQPTGVAGATEALELTARRAFLDSSVSCGIDVFFGGGPYDYIRQAAAGRLINSGVMQQHPEWFTDEVIPATFTGEPYRDPAGLWVGTVLSSYGMIYNRDAYARLGITAEPRAWEDLQNPKLQGEVALCDPTKSSSIAKAFENIIQQQIQLRWEQLAINPSRDRASWESQAIAEGWVNGLRLVQRIGANARYFTDTSQKPPIDVIQGNSAVGLCIDFYGRGSDLATARRVNGAGERVGYFSPPDGTVLSPDPIAVLRGAPHFSAAQAFMEYALSLDGQKLWNFKVGKLGGPERYELRRLPIRRDFYRAEFAAARTDPDVNPYATTNPLIYHPAWTGGIVAEMALVIRVMCQDTHPELVEAWREIIKAGLPPAALAVMSDMTSVSYAEMQGRIKQALSAKDKVEAVRLARELAGIFREQYLKAAALARATPR
ncbi:MAG: extracellular solute-binding protein [Opitutaceae bacterium]|nr:extracellular solute-binding protein [Opitutaceae bacterium]NBR58080.1 extracellular solute-binding protein [Opitutaceae bacterium]